MVGGHQKPPTTQGSWLEDFIIGTHRGSSYGGPRLLSCFWRRRGGKALCSQGRPLSASRKKIYSSHTHTLFLFFFGMSSPELLNHNAATCYRLFRYVHRATLSLLSEVCPSRYPSKPSSVHVVSNTY
jgi:hypothetical protein